MRLTQAIGAAGAALAIDREASRRGLRVRFSAPRGRPSLGDDLADRRTSVRHVSTRSCVWVAPATDLKVSPLSPPRGAGRRDPRSKVADARDGPPVASA
jgi:hypothetical protein